MADVLTKVKDFFIKVFGKMSKAQIIRLIIAVILFIVLVSILGHFLTRTEYEVLYSGLEPAEAGEILTQLTTVHSVDAKAEGDSILVPKGRRDELKMTLAAEGYPQSGITYDILAEAAGLGTTDQVNQEYIKRQLQQDIASTIAAMKSVKSARVILTLAKDSPFVMSRDNEKASASIMVTLYNNAKLTETEAYAIGQLVLTSVKNLSLEDISLVDSNMNYYNLAESGDITSANKQIALTAEVRRQIETQVRQLLTPVFGQERMEVSAHVKLDFDKRTTQETIFDPPVEGSEDGIAVSLKELSEVIHNYNEGGVAGFDSNGAAAQYPEVGGDDALYEKVTNEVNYELNETKNLIESAQGQIKELQVSVILDSQLELEDYTEQTRRLVATAVGVNLAAVTVERLPIQLVEEEIIDPPSFFTEHFDTILRFAIIALAIAALTIVILSITRSLRAAAQASTVQDEALLAEGEGLDLVAGEEDDLLGSLSTKKDSTAEKIEHYIDSDPDAVAQLLRNWLAEDYR